MGRGVFCALVVAFVAIAPGTARADSGSWFPHAADAEWTYQWTDTDYNPVNTNEQITVKSQKGKAFSLNWTTLGLGNPDDAAQSVGTMDFQETTSGLVNTNWQSSPPPPAFPVLCADIAQCGNSISSVLYQLIWGSRAPVLIDPLIKGETWGSKGGANADVTSGSQYEGHELVTVPAFPMPVLAAKVRSDITQAGAIGDPYGSGVRTVWWVYNVGPVKIEFQHAGGTDAPVTTAVLTETNQVPGVLPPDANYFPLIKGPAQRYRWTNPKHLKTPSVQDITVSQTANNSARVDVKHVSGPIRVAASYGFALRSDGLTNIWAASQAATLAKFPPLGPSFLPGGQRRHFFTPFDLMIYGMNPVLSAYPTAGQSWTAVNPSRDYSIFGVTGTTTVLGLRKVTVPAGTFTAMAIRSVLKQPGFSFGSGTRTSYFADGKGLVKLVFQHGDGSTSTVELIKKASPTHS
ncbi:MAG TPA: hypothetical protein VH108_12700 [Gaiellaceae bacterium]|jgi:hypothetical protein|nr:hypothetical protein [Gaiellaceae bacterium]